MKEQRSAAVPQNDTQPTQCSIMSQGLERQWTQWRDSQCWLGVCTPSPPPQPQLSHCYNNHDNEMDPPCSGLAYLLLNQGGLLLVCHHWEFPVVACWSLLEMGGGNGTFPLPTTPCSGGSCDTPPPTNSRGRRGAKQVEILAEGSHLMRLIRQIPLRVLASMDLGVFFYGFGAKEVLPICTLLQKFASARYT